MTILQNIQVMKWPSCKMAKSQNVELTKVEVSWPGLIRVFKLEFVNLLLLPSVTLISAQIIEWTKNKPRNNLEVLITATQTRYLSIM